MNKNNIISIYVEREQQPYENTEVDLEDIYVVLRAVSMTIELNKESLTKTGLVRKIDVKFWQRYQDIESEGFYVTYKVEYLQFFSTRVCYVSFKEDLDIANILTIYKLNPSKFIEYIEVKH